MSKYQQQSGVSFVETLVVLVLLGLLSMVAIPAMAEMVQRHRLQGAAESFRSDFHQARMHAMGTGRSVRVSFQHNEAGTCYVVHQGEAGSCTCNEQGVAQCLNPQHLVAHQWLPASRGLRLEANVKTMVIDAQRGTVSPTGTVNLKSAQGAHMAHVVAITGRVRTCGQAALHLTGCQS